jgi:hypothetical protein
MKIKDKCMKQIQTMSIDYWIESSLISTRPYIIKLKLEKIEAETLARLATQYT